MAITAAHHSLSGWGFSTSDLIIQARQRLPRTRIDQIAAMGGLTKKEIAVVLGITERNLYNQHQGDLSVQLSERLLLLEKLFEHGLAVFDHQQAVFTTWLRTPLAELATPEVGFAPPQSQYTPKPIAEMGTKQGPPDLSTPGSVRSLLPSQPETSAVRPYPTPLSLLDTITGCKLVDNVFTRIEAGVFS
ncbi:hypothetical protein [Spirosoma gilvum]